jgi:hypothetical protein
MDIRIDSCYTPLHAGFQQSIVGNLNPLAIVQDVGLRSRLATSCTERTGAQKSRGEICAPVRIPE